MAKKAKAQTKTDKVVAPKKAAAELVVINGRAKVTTTDKSPAHKAGIEINVIETTAKKMIANGWAIIK
jgi:hypothetical protein